MELQEADRAVGITRLRELHSRREDKRKHVAGLFQRKRELMEQLKAVEAEMSQMNDVLFDMDDQITEIEEQLGTSAEDLVEISATQPTQAADEFLTDPLSATQPVHDYSNPMDFDDGDNDDCTTGRASISSYFASARPQLEVVLQPVNRNTSNTNNRLSTSNDPVDNDAMVQKKPSAMSSPYSTEQIQNALNKTFLIQHFRENQLAIIQATLAKQDCFVIMRTGGGKSLLYQLPVVLERPKITLVISPLLSLMQDQQDQINDFCANVCVSFHSGLSKSQQAANWQRVRDPSQNVGMILVTPERVYKSNRLKSELQNLYANQRFARIVIDECHCCCQWGHDFRPDYAKLGVLRSTFATVPILAVTATASDRVREDCSRILKLHSNYRFFRSTANRPNLTYSILRKEGSALETLDDIASFIQTKHPNAAGIVYTRTRKEADTVAKELAERGISADAYYSDVSPTKKANIHKSWMKNKTQVVVATIAFGLGINKPDVRFVIHHSMSKTLEAYYQESGRAGRDGNPADCVLFYSPKDVPKMLGMVHGEQSSDLTWTMIKYAQHFGSDAVCRAILLQNLGEPNHDLEAALQMQQKDTTLKPRDVLSHSQTVLQLLYSLQDDKVTMPMLVKEWRSSKDTSPECVKSNPPGKELSTFECEYIIIALMLQKLIATDIQYTAYDVVVYLRCTDRAEQFLTSPRAQMTIRLPSSASKRSRTPTISPASRRKAATDGDGWIATRKTSSSTKRRRSSTTSVGSRKRTATSKKKAKTDKSQSTKKGTKPKKKDSNKPSKQSKISQFAADNGTQSSRAKPAEVIDIDDDSSLDEPLVGGLSAGRAVENHGQQSAQRPRRAASMKNNQQHIVGDDLASDCGEDEEYEFEA